MDRDGPSAPDPDLTGRLGQADLDAALERARRLTTGGKLEGIVEGLAKLHGVQNTGHHWRGDKPAPDTCRADGKEWPCPTIALVYEALGEPLPEQRTTACGSVHLRDADGSIYWTLCDQDAGHEGRCWVEARKDDPDQSPRVSLHDGPCLGFDCTEALDDGVRAG